MISKTFTSCNILKCSASTNCPKGGDSGHGGRTVLVLEDLASTDMSIEVDNQEAVQAEKVKLIFRGDTECETFIKALAFASKALAKKTKLNLKTYEAEARAY